MTLKKIVLAIVILVAFIITACGSQRTTTFVNLPKPVGDRYQTNVTVQTVGDVEDVKIGSPYLNVNFSNTGDGAGSNETEITCINSSGRCATMIEYNWGDFYTNSQFSSAEVYSPDGDLIEARITLKFKDASFLRMFACGSCTIDVSRLTMQYIPDSSGWPQLSRIIYVDEYGFASNTGVVAFGPGAIWDNASEIFPEYSRWGFWETYTSPVTAVKTALDNARERLVSETPTYKVVDEDGPSEVIGRQTGMKMYFEGEYVGDINLIYSNNIGRMPNTPWIGAGALSRIEWVFTNGNYYALSILSSRLDPRPTALYVFTNNTQDCTTVESTNYTNLYALTRSEEIPGAFLTIYSGGHVGKITETVTTSEGSDTVEIGNGGGVYYSVLGNPSLEDVQLAHNLLDLMGRGGIVATKFFYSTRPEQGNGILYYLATLTMMVAEPENVLDAYGVDSGLLDRVGFPNLEQFFVLP